MKAKKHRRDALYAETAGNVGSGVAGRIGAQARNIAHDVADFGGTMKDVAQEKLADLRSAANDAYEQGRAQARNASAHAERWIIRQPFKSVLIALGVGLVVGRLWPRR